MIPHGADSRRSYAKSRIVHSQNDKYRIERGVWHVIYYINNNIPKSVVSRQRSRIQTTRETGALQISGGGASQITLKGTWDSSGKELIVAPTTVSLTNDMLDVDGSGQHSTTLLVDAYVANDTDKLYLWIKTDTGTFTVSEFEITWIE